MVVAMAAQALGCNSEIIRLAGEVIRGRWFMVYASFLIMSAAGATYIFGLYSNDIKTSLGYSQQTLNTLSFFKDFGANGIVSGLINEIAPPWVVLAIGAAMNFSGYLMMWLAVTGRIARPRVWQMCIYISVGATSQAFANTGALVTCVKNFPESRGVVLGLLKGFVGLSGAIITQLFHAFYYNDTKSLILFIGWLPAAISMIFLYTIRIMKIVRQPNELKLFYYFLYFALALAGYLMVIIILYQRFAFSQSEYGGSAAIVLLLLCLPIMIVLREEARLWRLKLQSANNPTTPPPIAVSIVEEEKAQTAEPILSGCSRIIALFKSPNRGDDYNILQALVSIDMLILFLATICGFGGTLTAIDNMGQIGESLGYPSRSISTFVSLISIWNFAGRVASGFVSEIVLAKYRFPRPLMLTLVLLLSCVGHLLIAFGIPGTLYVASVIIGFCFGAQWPLLFAIISELFGLKYYSTLYNIGTIASPIGLYILNVRVAGHLYDLEAMKQKTLLGDAAHKGEDSRCIGVQCYRLAFIIITAVTFFGSLVSLLLVMRTRKFYKGDIYARFRDAPMIGVAEMGVARNSSEKGDSIDDEKPSATSSAKTTSV